MASIDRRTHAIDMRGGETVLRISSARTPYDRFRGIISRVSAMYWKSRFARFGAGSAISSPAMLVGARYIEIGSRVNIWPGGRLEALPTEFSNGKIVIGDGTCIQPYVHIGSVLRVDIGEGVLVASGVYISDHDHSFHDPQDPPITNKSVVASAVSIGDFVWLGERVMVLKGVSIGEHSVIGAGAIVTKDIPPYSVAVGAPARVIRRYSIEDRGWFPVGEPCP